MAAELEDKSNTNRLMDQLEEAGKEIFINRERNNVHNASPWPVMLPACPISQFIDKFPADTHTKKEATAAIKQAQYEGEVEVFRSLERLPHPIFVMHSFKYTHQQYSLFVDHQCTKKDMEDEGEADFVAVQDDLIAIYEVKAVESAFERNYKKSRKQLEKTSILIKNICKKTGSFEPKIFKYTVFANMDRKSADKISKFTSLGNFEKSEILFKDDLFFAQGKIWIGNCYDDHLKDYGNQRFIPNDIKAKSLWTLLGIWCVNEKNEFNKDKWDLGRTINCVDNLLKNASISSRPAEPKSSKVEGSPPELKELGILCLTVEQRQILDTEKKRIIINGPAGSGKTVMILGKIIQLARESAGLIIVIVPSRLIADWYVKNLRKVGIESVRELTEGDIVDQNKVFIQNIEDYEYNKLGLVNHCAMVRLSKLYESFAIDAHIFIDDFHAFDFAFSYYPHYFSLGKEEGYESLWEYTLAQLMKNSEKTFWLCYDTLQSTSYSCFDQQIGSIEKCESNNTIFKLSANLRNSYEIARFLRYLRKERLTNIQSSIIYANFMANYDLRFKPFDVEQDIGHYIHGPTPRIEWVDLHGMGNEKSEHLVNILTNEVANILSCDKIALIHDDYGDPVKNLEKFCVDKESTSESTKRYLQNLAAIDPLKLDEICQEAKEKIKSEFEDCRTDLKVLHMDEVISTEWPAVVAIIKVFEKFNIALDLEHDEIMQKHHNLMNQPFHYEFRAKQDPIDRLIAKMNAIISRGRAYCVLICVIDEEKPIVNTHVNKIEKNDPNEECINAAVLECFGNSAINKALYGELVANSSIAACESMNLTMEQIQVLIYGIHENDDPIRLPSGKMIPAKVFAESVASSYGLDLNDRPKKNFDSTDEQNAIYFRNRRKILSEPHLTRLVVCSGLPYTISRGTLSNPTPFKVRWQNHVKHMERMGLPVIEYKNDTDEERYHMMKKAFDYIKKAMNNERRAIYQIIEESALNGRIKDCWKKYRSLSPTIRYEIWTVALERAKDPYRDYEGYLKMACNVSYPLMEALPSPFQ